MAAGFIRQAFNTPNITVATVDRELFNSGLALYENRTDKPWGLTDCISFAIMAQDKLVLAATADKHFVQAGFRALMLES